MNILFAVPEDYKKIGGLKLPIDNHTKQMINKGNNVEIFLIPYNVSNGVARDELKKNLITVINDHNSEIIMTYGLNLSYMMIGLLNDKEFNGDKVCYMVDSMRLSTVSRRRHSKFGETSIKDLAREIIYTYKERKCLLYYSKIIYVSQVDVEYVINYYRISAEKVFYVPNGTNVPANYSCSKMNIPLRVGCLSGFSDITIKDNLAPLVSTIFPAIQAKYPEIELVIAGKGASEAYEEKMRATPNVKYLGFVNSLEDFYNEVDVVLTTVKKECGIINRILEAWSYGKPVVGYNRNFKTFMDASDGVHYISAETPEDFVKVIDGIVAKKIDIYKMGQNALELVKLNYTWEQCSGKLISILKR